MSGTYDVVIVGGGIAGGALAAVLARGGVAVAVLERDPVPIDRVRGEFMAPWGVAEKAHPFAFDVSSLLPGVPGPLCLTHPAMCAALAAGATILRGVEGIDVSAGSPPAISFRSNAVATEWRPRLVIGADGRNSQLRRQLALKALADPPHNLIGGMLVEGVPDWPQDLQVLGTEGRVHFLVFPQGGDRIRLYLCYDFADKAPYAGAGRKDHLIATFAGQRCLPYAAAIAGARPIGPFNSFSNEDHWVEDPTAPGVVLVGDAAGHNDPILGQGLSIALRDVRLVSEAILAGARDQAAFRPYVAERLERMRRLRITASLTATLRAEFGEEARRRRQRAGRRMRIDNMLAPFPASLIGPEKLPAAAFDQATIDALRAP